MSAAYLPLELHYEIHGESLRKEVSSGSHVLGREPGCEVVLNHPSVSRHHARLTLQRAAWEVRDLGSMNGTKVKGRRVESAEIADGDTVRVGDVDIVCRLGLLTPRAEELFLSAEEEEASDAVATSVHVDDLDSAVASMLASEARRPGVGATGPTSVRDPAWVVRVVQEAAGALLGELELNGVLRRILDLVFDNLPAHRGLVLLLEGNRLVPMAERAREGHAMQEMRISRRIAERASRAREAVLVRPRSEAGRTPSMVAMNVHSAVCAPLCHEGRVVGLLYVDRTSMDETFTETDRGVLSVLATLSGAAVERAQLRQSFEKERALRSRLSAYLAPAVVDHLVERRTAEFPSMASMEREISVLFGDIVGFTALSETLGAAGGHFPPERPVRTNVGDRLRGGRHPRQVHRRQHDGVLRSPDGAAGPRAPCGPHWPRDAAVRSGLQRRARPAPSDLAPRGYQHGSGDRRRCGGASPP